MKYLANKGIISEFGSRPLKRLIQKEIVNELAKNIISGKFTKNDLIVVDIKKDKLEYRNEK